ncbi:SsrA-binding protein [Terrimicrobium sacchariphilum]|uniref:SsrA-binding protein n=1 Tax=Terrimicrobium sacchariphilum TaxID=690879 RepID=A0A146G9A0_TERSA|nr:SsrA-binding protein SmpB [Terrimicrobium sacchariphilum]GAT33852.1 SsrA-binding protein [Terrimicrobium sacchariphilum]
MSAEIVVNRKAFRDYHILEKLEAGIELKGTEVKSIRLGHVNLQGAFARLDGGEIFLYDSDIQPYLRASHEQHEPKRRRRLLLHRLEIDKVAGAIEQAGRTLVALRMYWKKGRVKVELGLGKGKQDVDKRADLKKRVQEREIDRVLAGIQRKR